MGPVGAASLRTVSPRRRARVAGRPPASLARRPAGRLLPDGRAAEQILPAPHPARRQRESVQLLWYGDGVVGQHEKKNNPESGHTDLVAVIDGLNRTTGDAQWEFIQQHFNVEEMANYFAVSMCIENWDGFFNNYFSWHDPKPGGKWEVFPWDEDKTWGDYDGASPARDWYTMPLTYGMNGDREPTSRLNLFRQRNHPWGTVMWWRPGGYFSRPAAGQPAVPPALPHTAARTVRNGVHRKGIPTGNRRPRPAVRTGSPLSAPRRRARIPPPRWQNSTATWTPSAGSSSTAAPSSSPNWTKCPRQSDWGRAGAV